MQFKTIILNKYSTHLIELVSWEDKTMRFFSKLKLRVQKKLLAPLIFKEIVISLFLEFAMNYPAKYAFEEKSQRKLISVAHGSW